MFRSARLKLTLFYLVILLGFSLVLTVTLRIVAEQEYNHSISVQLGQFRHLLENFHWQNIDLTIAHPDNELNSIQSDQAAAVREHLNRDFASINAAALLLAGILSYWFAGRTLEPIEEAHRTQARFVADASHELRTPLASIRIENEVFLRAKQFDEGEARRIIESNLEEVQRLEHLSNTLLMLTHYENVRLPIAAVDIREIAEDVVSRVKKTLSHDDADFSIDVSKGRAYADKESLEQLLHILVDNALKYGPPKGKIVIKGVRQTGFYILTVSDEGPGIAEEDMPHIFERLYRSDKSRTKKTGGYGLGLSLAREISRANGGSITVSNRKPQGACFTVRLLGSR